MDLLDEFADYMNAQRKSPAATATAATTAVEMDAATDTTASAAFEMDATTAAPKHKGRDSPAAIEIAPEKRKCRDSPASVEIDATTAATENRAANARLLAGADAQRDKRGQVTPCRSEN